MVINDMPADLPNILTLSRIAAIPAIILLVAVHTPTADVLASAVFCLAALTDYFDGKIARTKRIESELGGMLDPIADKLLVGAVIMVLIGEGRISHSALYPSIIIVLREILVSGLREYLAKSQVRIPVTHLAKWKTGFQMSALAMLLAGDPSTRLIGLGSMPTSEIGEGLLWISAWLTLWTGWQYLRRGWAYASLARRPAKT
jgi:cardiolipin synthase (CMP-forming)